MDPEVSAGDNIMKDFRGYPLFIDELTTPEDDPTDARIDKYTITRLIHVDKLGTWYKRRWPVEFDMKKNVKANRMPFGYAAKIYDSQRPNNSSVIFRQEDLTWLTFTNPTFP